MFENLFNRNLPPLSSGNPLEMQIAGQMITDCSVSNILKNSYSCDQVDLLPPLPIGGIPATGLSSYKSPTQQLIDAGNKYQIPYTGGDMETYQKRVVKALIMHKAMEYNVPLSIALGVAGNESGWKMWSNVEKGTLVKCNNPGSTDWGAMQLNDSANPKAFPRAKLDLEYNVDYGMKFLAGRLGKIKGNLGLGFGEHDRAIASYNLGHNPVSKRDYEIASRYVSHVKKQSTLV
jgi:soluble lytic murein transglycosylase-like protein